MIDYSQMRPPSHKATEGRQIAQWHTDDMASNRDICGISPPRIDSKSALTMRVEAGESVDKII